MTGELTRTTSKERNGATRPSYQLSSKNEVPITLHCQLCSTCYTAVQIKNSSKSTSTVKVATMKNMDDFCYEGEPSCATAKLTLFAVSKDEWDTKEDNGKSMKNASYMLQAPLGLKLCQTVKTSSL